MSIFFNQIQLPLSWLAKQRYGNKDKGQGCVRQGRNISREGENKVMKMLRESGRE